jgi:predicted Fe-Mo cluster-binding NifX family protein
MKIAFVTEDGVSISKHFGRALSYIVVDIDGKTVRGKESRLKVGCSHSHGSAEEGANEEALKHRQMSDPISDCSLVVSGGMGFGAYQSLILKGIRAMITDIDLIDDAVAQYMEGKLEDHPELLH